VPTARFDFHCESLYFYHTLVYIIATLAGRDFRSCHYARIRTQQYRQCSSIRSTRCIRYVSAQDTTVFDMLAELPEKDGPGSFKKAVNFVKNKCKKDSSSEKAPNFKISSKPKSADAKECKEIAFHHAGYDPDSHNTVMFRLKGSKSYTGGVRGSTVIMMLFILLGQEGLESLHFALRRGKDFIHVHRNTILKKSDYYVHRIDPDNPADLFYRYPLVPCFRLWTMPKIMIDLWTATGARASSTRATRSTYTSLTSSSCGIHATRQSLRVTSAAC
jgi:hypothetical protein